MLDIPRSVFGIGFYTEQFLTICLGLTLALAYIADTARPRNVFDWVAVIASLALCGYIALRYEHLTLDAAFLPLDALIVSILLIALIAEASRRTNGWGFVSMIAGIAVYVYISPHLPGDFQTRYVSPERMVTYLGLDLNGAIGNILQVAVLVVIPYEEGPGLDHVQRSGERSSFTRRDDQVIVFADEPDQVVASHVSGR